MSINELEELIAQKQAELDELDKQLKVERNKLKVWKPISGEQYSFINGFGEVACGFWDDRDDDEQLYQLWNCFATDEEAEHALNRLKVFAQLKRIATEYNEPIKWCTVFQPKYFLNYNAPENKITIDYNNYMKNVGVYFSSDEIAQRAIDIIGEERLKKYYFEVE